MATTSNNSNEETPHSANESFTEPNETSASGADSPRPSGSPDSPSASNNKTWSAGEAFKTVLYARYDSFDGRASRSEYWLFQLYLYVLLILFEVAFTVVLSPIATVITLAIGPGGATLVTAPFWVGALALSLLLIAFTLISILASLLLLVAGISLTIRRLHDAGYSAWFMLFGLVPYIGGLVLLVFSVLPSDKPNQWGDGPQGPATDEEKKRLFRYLNGVQTKVLNGIQAVIQKCRHVIKSAKEKVSQLIKTVKQRLNKG